MALLPCPFCPLSVNIPSILKSFRPQSHQIPPSVCTPLVKVSPNGFTCRRKFSAMVSALPFSFSRVQKPWRQNASDISWIPCGLFVYIPLPFLYNIDKMLFSLTPYVVRIIRPLSEFFSTQSLIGQCPMWRLPAFGCLRHRGLFPLLETPTPA